MDINSRSGPLPINESLISSRRQLVLMLAILLVAAGLRWLDLGAGSIWFDEANQYWTASQNLNRIFSQTRFILLDPPLYSYFLHFWSKLGMSEFFLRFPSLVFSLLGVAGAMAVGYQLGGRRTGLLSGFLLAISPTDIRYAQDIGQYTLMTSLVFWNFYFLIKIFQSKDPGWRLLFAWLGLALLATYTKYMAVFAVLIPFGINILVGVFSKHWERLYRNVITLFFYGIGSIPLILYYLPYQLSSAMQDHKIKMGLAPSWSTFIDLGSSVMHKVSFLFTGWPFTHIPEWIPFGIVTLLFLDNLATLNRTNKPSRIWLIWLVSLFALYSLYNTIDSDAGNFRHGLFFLGMVVPFVSLRLSVCFESKWKKWPAVALLLMLVGISLISSPQRSLRNMIYPNESWPWPESNYNLRPAFTHWLENRQVGEPIYIYFGGNLVFRYYLHLFGVDQCQQEPPGIPCPADDVIYGEWFNNQPDQAKISNVKRSLPDQVNSFWLLLTSVHSNDDDLILKALQSDYQIVDQSISRGVQLYRFERKRGLLKSRIYNPGCIARGEMNPG